MNNNNTFPQKLERFLAGKGFYAVLFACICIIGVSAWAMYSDRAVPESTVQTSTPPKVTESVPKVQEKVTKTDEVTPKEKSDTKKVAAEQKEETAPVSAPVDPVPEQKTEPVFSMPLTGDVTGPFSDTALVYSKTLGDWRTHLGTDFSAQVGCEVCAVCDGIVKDVYTDDLLGKTVMIDHGDGYVSSYSNLDNEISVVKGDVIKSGTVIGKVGSTAIGECKDASHLHFSLSADGKYVDPMKYIAQ